jgi:putative transposase
MPHSTPEQIVKLLRQADKEIAQGRSVEDFCRRKHISTATYYRWHNKYAGLNVSEAKRLKALETENAKLKKLLAEAMLANDGLREFLAKKA